mmetsp:Transcript_10309/g.11770  ORF Transcript_10309/g.11770 Transcript_10309/m.11770 type:complete len:415 (-) Transcript_10309:309-1553(-)|eukprot:CAMPEP_0194145612 /NCGR_PEP_ID=MMETSP0152-20130528/17803_1 /TAXON_ID=1049557 /ORGANISM="Thalassiothrix antarctica, Strain L6-D1" /LENGTH=414 /DNA_ID=CAMNT_0038845891 /DNA_START=63 /DNA_END=1307 /DNA_ORIENTATION=-
MKYFIAALLLCCSDAFTTSPSPFRLRTAHFVEIESNALSYLPQQFPDFHEAFSSVNLADAADAVDAVANIPAADDNGWFGFLTTPIEGSLQVFHSMLVSLGLNNNSWGWSILLITVAIKALTYPLTKSQLESSNKMQSLQPQIKEIQSKYQSNPEVMNQKIAEFYKTNQVNPLAGCIPSLVQIPVFIGLYRAVLQLAKDDKLNEPFLWLPNLEGPTYGALPANANEWITKGWENGVPSLGWGDTISFLILPAFLAISQFVSMEVMKPQPGPDGKEPAEQPAFLKALPLLFAWFSLNVPSGLTIYWAANSILSTATSVYIRNQMPAAPIASAGGATMVEPSSVFGSSSLRETPVGFGNPFDQDSEMSPVTPLNVVDAEVLEVEKESAAGSGSGMESMSPKRGGNKKKKKKKKRRS